MKKPWFKAKTYGWGWMPATWQGWAVTIIYTLLIIVYILYRDTHLYPIKDIFLDYFVVFILILLLIITAYKTGEKPRWRWGKKKSS